TARRGREHRGKSPLLQQLTSPHFTLCAIPSQMKVGVKQAADLKAMDSGGTSDPYVIVYLTSDTKKKYETKVYRKTLNPVFNESFTFQVRNKNSAPWVQRQGGENGALASAGLALQAPQPWLSIWCSLLTSLQQQEQLGEVCFSLRYVPSTGKLTVVVVEARKLKRMDSRGLSDPFVKVHLILNRKKWKKRKTSVKKNTLSPYFNEVFVFEVPFNQIQNVDLVISIWDHDKVTKNEQIGKLFLGCRATGNQLRHWSDMLSNPRRPVAQWHSLQAVDVVDKALGLKTHLKLPLPTR
uniref:Synaptotagmin 8 n=1 Tax=Apteryx owenii TaxID=8824 RepID=A0A8B9NXR1_APTOW